MSLEDVNDFILELLEDSSLPKNVRETLRDISGWLQEPAPDIHKVLQELEEVVEAADLDSYIRTQLWDLMSALERQS